MLGDIVNGREKSSVIGIEDSARNTAVDLEVCFIHSLAQRVDEVHVLSFERAIVEWDSILSRNSTKNLFIHDFFTDVNGWDVGSNQNVDTDIIAFGKKLWTKNDGKTVAVVFDTLTHLLLAKGTPRVCHIIDQLKLMADKTLCILHGDLHNKTTKNLIHHICSTSLLVTPSENQNFIGVCDILHKRQSGKVIKLKEGYNISSTFEIMDVSQIQMSTKTQTDHDQPDPAGNLTFNLSLSDKEKEAKRQVTLPYTLQQTNNAVKLNITPQTESKIFYQPDDADDFDEEDPDDDLSI